jgi:hypothetical protein
VARLVRLDRGERDSRRSRSGRAAKRGYDGGFVNRTPSAAFQAATHPLRGDVLTFRTAVLGTRFGHAVTVAVDTDKPSADKPTAAGLIR